MKREYSLKTERLIKRTEKIGLLPYRFNQKKILGLARKSYDLFDLSFPKKIVICKDIFDKRLVDVFDSAYNAYNASRAYSAYRASRASIEYDFDWFVYVFEYLQDHEGDKNDRLVKKALNIFIEMREEGLGYWAEWKNTLYLIPNPIISLDSEGSYHCEDKPAIYFKDGAKLYYYHGVNVPAKVILHPEKLTKKDWSSEENAEVRRVIQERMGEDFVKKIKGKVINKGKLGELYEIKLPDDPEKIAHYVKV